MRKLLLACAAAVGFTGAAHAANMDLNSAAPKVEPGKMVVRLDTQFLFYAGVSSDDGNKNGADKNQNYGFDGHVRLYPSMDAMTTNGIKYGAAIEIRTNSAGNAPSAGSSGKSGAQTFYIRRAYGYVGTDAAGTLRFGQIDGPFGALKVGDMQSVGDGGVNGDVPSFTPSIGGAWKFPFSVGNEYASSKLIYLSPSFAGFDFGVSFQPSTQPLLGGVPAAAVGGAAASSSSVVDARPRNIFEVNARYRGTFSGVGLAANVGYMGSGKVDGTLNTGFKGLSIIDAGAAVTYMGLTVGGHIDAGKFNGGLALTAAGEKDAFMYVVGANYEFGPYSIGAHYVNASTPGTLGNGVARKDSVVAGGATWNWAPGATLLAEVMTGSEDEGAVKTQGTGFIIGQKFRW